MRKNVNHTKLCIPMVGHFRWFPSAAAAAQLGNLRLLERLSNSQGNLLEDTELIEVLANTKAKAKEVEGKLKEADERTG